MFTQCSETFIPQKRMLLVRNTWLPTQNFFPTQSSPQGSRSPSWELQMPPMVGHRILLSQVPNPPSPGQGSIILQLFFGCFSAVFCRTLHSVPQTWVSFHKNLLLHIPVNVPAYVAMVISVRLGWRSLVLGWRSMQPPPLAAMIQFC